MKKLVLARHSNIAQDELTQIPFMNPEFGNSCASYDGGADIFIEDSKTKNALQEQFSEWPSNRVDGL